MLDSAFVECGGPRIHMVRVGCVVDLLEAESVGGGGGPGRAPVARGEHFDEGVGGAMPASDLQQCTNDDPHHGMEEAIGLDRELANGPLPVELCAPDPAQRTSGLE